MSEEMPNQEPVLPETPLELPPKQQVVGVAAKIAAVAIEASQDQQERSANIDKLKTELGTVGVMVVDLEDRPDDERRGVTTGLSREQMIMRRNMPYGRRKERLSQLGYKT